MARSRTIIRTLLAVHVAVGGAIIIALTFASPMVLGRGRFDAFAEGLETYNFKWWFTGIALAIWLLPIVLVVVWRRAADAGSELARIRDLVETVLKDRYLPVTVDVQARVPVRLDGPLKMPVSLKTNIDLDEMVELEADVPVKAQIPFDTEVETTILRFGTVRFPVRGLIPVDVVLPMKALVHVKARVPVDLREEAVVEVPPLDVPINARVEARIDLLQNLKTAGFLKKQ